MSKRDSIFLPPDLVEDNRKIMYCLDRIDDLEGWDKEFIDSLSELPVNKSLSAKQKEHLNRIYAAL